MPLSHRSAASSRVVVVRWGLEAGDTAAIRRAPKADLHSHLYLPPRLPMSNDAGPRHCPSAVQDGWLDGMRDYSRQAIGTYMDNRTAFEFTAGAALRHARSDGVVLLESSFDIWARPAPSGWAARTDDICRIAGIAVPRQVDYRPEVGFSRSFVSKDHLMGSLSEAIETGVFRSIDMYSYEDGCDPEAVRWIYEKARAQA